MKNLIMAGALALATTAALAAETAPAATGPTVEEAINVMRGLVQLSQYQSGVDKDGKPVTSPYRFGADVLYAMAIDIDIGRRVEARFNAAGNALIMQNSDGTGTVPEEKIAQHKLAVQKILDAPANVGFVRIKLDDLCLSVTPKCKDAGVATPNPIPAPVLSMIIPIVDR